MKEVLILVGVVEGRLAVGGGDLWLMSTPFGKRGFFYEAWSKEGRWARFNVTATDCARIPREFLEEEKAAMEQRLHRIEGMLAQALAQGIEPGDAESPAKELALQSTSQD